MSQINPHNPTLFSIIPFVRDHAPDAAAWMIDIAGIAGDDMDMAVHHALAGDIADVCADVVAVRCIFFVEQFFARVEQFEQGTSFIV